MVTKDGADVYSQGLGRGASGCPGVVPGTGAQTKKTDVDVRSLAVKTKTESNKAIQREQKLGQPA